jgi:integrase
METMPRPRPPKLQREINRHGTTVWYVRDGKGPRTRIKAAYGTPEFDDCYRAAINGGQPRPVARASKGTLQWLWDLYRETHAWTDLSMATRKQRENIMREVLQNSGAKPLSTIDGKAIQNGIDRRKPFAARHFVDTLRGMFKWAVTAEHVETDPTAGKAVAKPKTRGFPVWTEEELEQYEAHWPLGTRERVMLGVFCFTGLRRGDAARLGKQHISKGSVEFPHGVITIDTEKNGVRVTIPVLPELAEIIAAGPTGDLSIIASKKGQPLRKEVVGNLFKEACEAAGITKSAHGVPQPRARRTTARPWQLWRPSLDGRADRWRRSILRQPIVAGSRASTWANCPNQEHLFPHLWGRCGENPKKSNEIRWIR